MPFGSYTYLRGRVKKVHRCTERSCTFDQLEPAKPRREVYVPLADWVYQGVDPNNLTVYNITEQGHAFDPGYVKRSVVQERDGSISVQTIGEGTGQNRSLNLEVARPAFTWLDSLIRLRTIPEANGPNF